MSSNDMGRTKFTEDFAIENIVYITKLQNFLLYKHCILINIIMYIANTK